jgi:hypothetical protein
MKYTGITFGMACLTRDITMACDDLTMLSLPALSKRGTVAMFLFTLTAAGPGKIQEILGSIRGLHIGSPPSE